MKMENSIYKDYLKLKKTKVFDNDEDIIKALAKKYKVAESIVQGDINITSSTNIFNFENDSKKIVKFQPVLRDELSLMYKYLEKLDRSDVDLQNLESETLSILEKINVKDEVSEFCIKGLVIGDIQSGKTSSMISLILGAFDIGYETVIVLSGLIEDLRNQTGFRINESIGIDPNDVETLISMSDYGIVNQTLDKDVNIGSLIAYKMNETKKTYWIIKKTANKLKVINEIYNGYNEDVKNSLKNNKESTIAKKMNSKILLIDDEADLASQDNSPSKTEEVSKTNQLVIELLKQFKKVALISYTATPFANLLTNKNRTHMDETLFPDSFISLLSPGVSYTGFEKYKELDSEVNNVKFLDEEKLFDYKKNNNYEISNDTDFKTIVKIFLTSVAIFKYQEIRENVKIENFKTMLVNIDIKNISQELLKKEFSNIITSIVTSLNRFKELYKNDLEELLKKDYKYLYDEYANICHEEFWYLYKQAALNCQVEVINKNSKSKNSDRLFDENSLETNKDKILIVIGGYKLSRGLTIPGLFTTVFYRNTNNFDTAMQMCRWFGYRDNYINYTTLYTTQTAWDNFCEMFETYEDFKRDVQVQGRDGLTAEEFIIKISASESLLPTSRNKMKGAEKLYDKWSKTGRNQIYNYQMESKILQENIESLKKLTLKLKFEKTNQNYVARKFCTNMLKSFLMILILKKKAKKKLKTIKFTLNKAIENEM
ncbi:putative endonuclease [Spiroplasma clarkii]|uniref:Z1 domain-containing protein n=1 Tax=Spiroplasma clarkii TaxID=2139 RepID=UPI000B574FA5|nr:Z1 domain-containing protein [Spiroplasma clarkii]ARU91826.1 putative endonuclease [Spiroplasma clarkii]